jgi:hypothetical protein
MSVLQLTVLLTKILYLCILSELRALPFLTPALLLYSTFEMPVSCYSFIAQPLEKFTEFWSYV